MSKKMNEKTGKKTNEKGILAWAKELKHNEKFAKKFEGVKTVKDILSVAKQNGYEFSEQELVDLDLDAVAGGALFGADFDADFDAKLGVFTDVDNDNSNNVLVDITKADMNVLGTGYKSQVSNRGGISISKR